MVFILYFHHDLRFVPFFFAFRRNRTECEQLFARVAYDDSMHYEFELDGMLLILFVEIVVNGVGASCVPVSGSISDGLLDQDSLRP